MRFRPRAGHFPPERVMPTASGNGQLWSEDSDSRSRPGAGFHGDVLNVSPSGALLNVIALLRVAYWFSPGGGAMMAASAR